MSGLSHRIEYVSLRGFIRVCRLLPRGAALGLGSRLGDLLFGAIRIRRRVVLGNLAAAFPEKTETERLEIARSCYRVFGRTAVEFARLPGMSPEAILDMGEIVGREHLAAVADAGRGCILLTGHFGNWEWGGAAIAALGHKVDVVVGEHHNKLVGLLLDRMRAGLGVGVLNAEHDLRGILESLRSRHFVAIVGDQDAGRDGIFVDFFGRPASTAVGPVRLAGRFQAPILQGFDVVGGDGRHRLELHPPRWIPGDGDESEAIRRHTEDCVRALEETVRRRPENWFWMHRRWKTQPTGGEPKRGGET